MSGLIALLTLNDLAAVCIVAFFALCGWALWLLLRFMRDEDDE